MLKGIPPILSPELLKTLCEMGHSDRLLLADGNFPLGKLNPDVKVIRMDGHGIPELLEAILTVFPLDHYVKHPVTMMAVMDGDPVETPIWDVYGEILGRLAGPQGQDVEHIDRFEFYRQVKDVYAVVTTGEKALYGNILLQKGVV